MKSTSGVLIFVDGILVSFFSRTQKQTAMSSCEAEYIAMASGVSEAMYVKRLIEFLWGKCAGVDVFCDSSSARQLGKKKGVGSIRHLDLKTLFVQRFYEEKLIDIKPIAGTRNPADILTKAVGRETLVKYFEFLGLADIEEPSEARRATAVRVKSVAGVSVIARVALVLGVLPNAMAQDYENDEGGGKIFYLLALVFLIGAIVGLVVGWKFLNGKSGDLRFSVKTSSRSVATTTWVDTRSSSTMTEGKVLNAGIQQKAGIQEKAGIQGIAGMAQEEWIYVSSAGDRAHLRRNCQSLWRSNNVRELKVCLHCRASALHWTEGAADS